MKLTKAQCPHCLFDKQDVEIPDLEYNYSKKLARCTNCQKPMEITVRVDDPGECPF